MFRLWHMSFSCVWIWSPEWGQAEQQFWVWSLKSKRHVHENCIWGEHSWRVINKNRSYTKQWQPWEVWIHTSIRRPRGPGRWSLGHMKGIWIPCNFTRGSPHSLTIEGGAHKPTNKQKKQGVRITLFAITVFFFPAFYLFLFSLMAFSGARHVCILNCDLR